MTTPTEGKSPMSTNGSGPDGLAARIADELEQLAAYHLDEAQKAMKALTALQGTEPEPVLTIPGPIPAPKRKAKKGDWRVSDGKVAKVLAAVKTLTEPASATAIGNRAGSSHQTTLKALEVLREREQVRVAGHRSVGRHSNTTLWMPMPENVPATAERVVSGAEALAAHNQGVTNGR